VLSAAFAVTAGVVASCLFSSTGGDALNLACAQGVTSRTLSYRANDLAGGVTEWTPIAGVVSFAQDRRPQLVPVFASFVPPADGARDALDVVTATVLF